MSKPDVRMHGIYYEEERPQILSPRGQRPVLFQAPNAYLDQIMKGSDCAREQLLPQERLPGGTLRREDMLPNQAAEELRSVRNSAFPSRK